MAEMTPMMKQYLAVKAQHREEILFFRLGDFYEMFFDDAKLASRELELTLTGKDCGMEERAPMCGIPYPSCEGYIARLVAKGYKVAICEQMEDPALAKGLVKRDIIRVITPGTVIEGSMLDEAKNNFLAGVCVKGRAAGVCFADVSTGEAHVTRIESDELERRLNNELGRFMPSEVVLNAEAAALPETAAFLKDRIRCTVNVLDDGDFDPSEEKVLRQFGLASAAEAGLDDKPETVMALGAILTYLARTQITGLERLSSVYLYSEEQYMRLDLAARRNLELCETLRNKEKRGTLLWVLDQTVTAMGKRLIRTWVEQPLLNCAAIVRRLNAVEELCASSALRDELAERLSGIYDLERLMTRIVYGSANGRELRSLAQTVEKLPGLRAALSPVHARMLREIYGGLDPLEDVGALIDKALVDDPPVSVKEGGILRKGYDPQVDELRGIMVNGKGFLADIEARERERTGIRNLKISYNRVFGYYIEVTKANLSQVPEDYIRKQTLVNCERFVTQELKELEGKVLGAQERVVALEYERFDEVRKKVAGELHRIQSTARSLAQLDVLCSFAEVAVHNSYCRPDISLDGRIVIKDGRHPVVEAILEGVPFVPNDTMLDTDGNRMVILTGPNMSGKSTYMRQTALITLMAQVGSFVPASSAHIGIVDAIFTRVGASDDLAAGQSTFMVEMSEVADILREATPKSLLILDEIGRGTSTFDGMSIARAVVEYVCDKRKIGAKTLFATHYHELTVLEDVLDGVKNYNIAVKKHGDDITFLRRIIRGGADDSYGIEVAKLAGIPDKVISRARAILTRLEAEGPAQQARGGRAPSAREAALKAAAAAQVTMIDSKAEEVMARLRSIDANTLTPIESLNLLFELCHIAQGDR